MLHCRNLYGAQCAAQKQPELLSGERSTDAHQRDSKGPGTAVGGVLSEVARGRLSRHDLSTMARHRTQEATPDLFSAASSGETSPATKLLPLATERHVLPQNLPTAVKHLNDQELDLLISACLNEAKR